MIPKRVVFVGTMLVGLLSATTALRAQTGGFAYVANFSDNNMSAYTIDGTTGALTPVPGSPVPAGVNPYSVAVDPTGQFAYVANYGSDSVSAYRIDERGHCRRAAGRSPAGRTDAGSAWVLACAAPRLPAGTAKTI